MTKEKLITFDKIDQFAFTNLDRLKKPIKGIAIQFFGLGHNKMIDPLDAENKYVIKADGYAKRGILYVFPYNDPWNWMNRQAVAFTDEVIDALICGLALPDDIPIVSTGGSMGGQSALVYTRYAKRTPVACVANCPVCDMPYHFTERKDLPRTLYYAFGTYDMPLDEALRSVSPLHLACEMPDVDYHIFHCDCDKAVNIEMHSMRFVAAMKDHRRITLRTVHGRGHCDLDEESEAEFDGYVFSAVNDHT